MISRFSLLLHWEFKIGSNKWKICDWSYLAIEACRMFLFPAVRLPRASLHAGLHPPPRCGHVLCRRTESTFEYMCLTVRVCVCFSLRRVGGEWRRCVTGVPVMDGVFGAAPDGGKRKAAVWRGQVSTKDANDMSFEGNVRSQRCKGIHWWTKRIWAGFYSCIT